MNEGNETDVAEMLQLQVSEIEMLISMYPSSEEFVLDDALTMAQIQSFLDGNIGYDCVESRFGFTLKLTIDEVMSEIVCHLPHEYPGVPPEIFIRCEELTKSNHKSLGEKLQSFIVGLDRGEICLFPIVEWLQENTPKYITASKEEKSKELSTKSTKQINYDTTFSRLWIYSHHIYSKIKRKAILDYSAELNLTGFCMPGKPGIICVEGYSCMAEDFWHRIRRMTWKSIKMKDREDVEIGDKSVDDFRKFEKLEEKYFDPRQGKGRGAHSDRGMLFHYLEEHGCGAIFLVYFGVDGKCADDSE
ncbi:hypothetical protein CAPTEDRAFT_124827 [Capitella teleta]|uniref:RWD domain-containing protein n=1 Tax=Capitella teleta TaxID=283909 RepID=R7U433_CAPTE|nr:hypothetical protein CAPTEDRAFT_124827 [Capitella teleta]|eukprot:ELT98431.1 hypothetical protein CAPTEDRAFT_124827 [Capitella teleta]